MIIKTLLQLILLSICACIDTTSLSSANDLDSSLVTEEVTNEDIPSQEHVTSSSSQVQKTSRALSQASGPVFQEPATFNYPSDVEMESNNLIRDTLRISPSSSTPVVATISSTSTTPVLVWGEVGRGIVAATPDYDRGELGRKPLLLTANRGRSRSGPYFEEELPPSNVTAPTGSTVYLDCRVAMLQDKVVTWAARRLDRLRLLTVGKQAYSADKRFSLNFRYPNNWRLQIQNTTKSDQGYYECQVAAHPPITRQIYLSIINPEVSISDEGGRLVVERYYKSGSSLQLTCSGTQLLQPPTMLAWWQGHNILSDSSSCNVTGLDSATCTLYLDQVSRSHAGTYTCGAFPQPHIIQSIPDIAPAASVVAATTTKMPAVFPSQQADGSFVAPPFTHYANASVAVHVLHGNLIGVAVLPNTGKSVGSNDKVYISLQKIILGLMLISLLQNR